MSSAGLNIPISAGQRSRTLRRPHRCPPVAPRTPALVPAAPRGLHTHRTPGSRPAAVTPEAALGARLRGGESSNMECLLVEYACSSGEYFRFPARAVAMAPQQRWAESCAAQFPARLSYFPERYPPPPLPARRRRAHVVSSVLKIRALDRKRKNVGFVFL